MVRRGTMTLTAVRLGGFAKAVQQPFALSRTNSNSIIREVSPPNIGDAGVAGVRNGGRNVLGQDFVVAGALGVMATARTFVLKPLARED